MWPSKMSTVWSSRYAELVERVPSGVESCNATDEMVSLPASLKASLTRCYRAS